MENQTIRGYKRLLRSTETSEYFYRSQNIPKLPGATRAFKDAVEKQCNLYRKRKEFYQEKIRLYGATSLYLVKGKLRNSKNFTIYLSNLEMDEITEVMKDIDDDLPMDQGIDFQVPFVIQTITTKQLTII